MKTIVIALLSALFAVTAPAMAQDAMTKSFAGMSGNSNEPIDIESDALEVDDAKKTAIFKGDVKAMQGGMTLQSSELEVVYAGQGAGAIAGGAPEAAPVKQPASAKNEDAGSPKAEIKTIHARGKVLLSTDKDQSATSEWALFDVAAQTITIGGNVVLSQGENVIKGDRLVVDLKTGQSRFDTGGGVASGGGGGRVKGLFMPSQKQGAAKKDAESAPLDLSPPTN